MSVLLFTPLYSWLIYYFENTKNVTRELETKTIMKLSEVLRAQGHFFLYNLILI